MRRERTSSASFQLSLHLRLAASQRQRRGFRAPDRNVHGAGDYTLAIYLILFEFADGIVLGYVTSPSVNVMRSVALSLTHRKGILLRYR